MTLAVKDLKEGSRVIDVAIHYGYDTQESFSRAFTRFHGVSPAKAMEYGNQLNYFPKAFINLKEESNSMSTEHNNYILQRKPSSELFKHRAVSPITLLFPVSMWTYMEFQGQNTNTMQNYTLLSTWSGDAYASGLSMPSASGIKEALDAFGYKFEICTTKKNDPFYHSENDLKEKIVNEITLNKRPVIAFNMVDCCFGGIIIGYEDNANTLLNWGYFPFDYSENPQPNVTKCCDWYSKTHMVVFIGERNTEHINLKDLYIGGLKKASEYIGDGKSLNNLTFYETWKDKLINEYPQPDNDFSIIDPMWCDLAERRFYAGHFMLQLREFLPTRESDLNSLYNSLSQQINEYMIKYISLVDLEPGGEQINKEKFSELSTRKLMCNYIDQCMESEKNASILIKKLIDSL